MSESKKCAKCHAWFLHTDLRVLLGQKLFHKHCIDEKVSLKAATVEAKQEILLDNNSTVLPSAQLSEIRAQVDSVAPPYPPIIMWDCNICLFLQNSENLNACSQCGFPKGSKQPEEENDGPRWICNVCLLDNHPLSSFCAFCLSDRNAPPLPSLNPQKGVAQPSFPPEIVIAAVEENTVPVQLMVANNEPLNVTLTSPSVVVIAAVEETAVPVQPMVANNEPLNVTLASPSAQQDASCASPNVVDAAMKNSTENIVVPLPCIICDQDVYYDPSKSYLFHPTCSKCHQYCPACYANWIKSQIGSGKASELKCPCLSTKVTYREVTDLSYLLRGNTDMNLLEIYEEAIRRNNVQVREQLVQCPDCHTMEHIVETAKSFPCKNPRCGLFNVEICCKHQCHFSKIEGFQERLCAKCVKETSDDPIVYHLLQYIIEHFLEDHCPACKQVVGLPEDITGFCMALACSHCPMSFCGFCYNFANSWQGTHIHVRACELNPRRNYFVESAEEWYVIQEKRKKSLIMNFLHTSRVMLSEVQHKTLFCELDKLLSR